METSRLCRNCKRKSLTYDDSTGALACSFCGRIQEFDDFQTHVGGISGPEGTFIRVGTAGSGTVYSNKERKINEARRAIEDVMLKLGFSASKENEVKTMIATITESEFGQGNWFPVLIGACAYIVMRKDNKSVPMVDAAGVVGCDVYELGRMINRVVDYLDLKLPDFDVVSLFERAVKTSSSFSSLPREKLKKLLSQGVFLVNCAVKWFLTTGRRPLPVVVAVLVLVSKVNDVKVEIEDLARDLNVAPRTSKLRYKELLQALVNVAKALPWGEDVTVKNIVNNAPFILQYMEMKSRIKPTGKRHLGIDLDDLVTGCLSEEIGYVSAADSLDDDSRYFEVGDRNKIQEMGVIDVEPVKISHQCLSVIYSNFLNEVNHLKWTGKSEDNHGQRKRKLYELSASNEQWTGKSDMSKKLLLNQLLEKDVGLDVMPPSFINGCEEYNRRRKKINAAKSRIKKIMSPSIHGLDDMNSLCISEHLHAGKRGLHAGKRRRGAQANNTDWEDLIIETLLLHQVKEEEIEKGHYNTLMDLHVFNSG